MCDAYFFTTDLCVGYEGKTVVENVTCSLKKGEILTLIGPNGAGKSTILKSIAGQLALLGGAVYLDGQSLTDKRPQELARQLSVLLTGQMHAELMTCADVVASGRYPYTGRFGILSKKDRRVMDEAMELVHVEKLRGCPFERISDGQKQRVLLARAIAQEPEILVLDEPTSYLDVKYKLEFLSVLQEMCRKRGLTVVMSLHELDLAERISDRILCIRDAHVEKFGQPRDIFQKGYIRALFDIESGSYDEANSSAELAAVKGEPQVFVIAGGGTGKHVYRRLQRAGVPFATGILFSNDLDTPVAHALASEVIEAEGFEPVGEALYAQAKEKLDACRAVICCRPDFGSLEWANERLLAYAQAAGKPVSRE